MLKLCTCKWCTIVSYQHSWETQCSQRAPHPVNRHWVVTDEIMWISIHLVCASTNTMNIFPMNGPAKSTWTLAQGRCGHFHRWSTVGCMLFLDNRHGLHVLNFFSIPATSPGHQTYCCARFFILETPGCASWSSFKTCACKVGGTMTWIPHSMYPSCRHNSSFLLEKDNTYKV